MSLTGRVFTNRYEIQREIAQGGMAEVYLARDRLLERNVALKALFPEFAREPSFVERFRREAQAAANLNHPNIVGIYDWGQDTGTYFIVMEAVEGRALRDLIRSEGPLDPNQAADIAAEIAAGLAFAHRNGVVHRDVKPGNVLITPSGDVKVTDFGIARAGTTDGLTQTGSVMGTATYFSPEQAQGLPVDGRSDVYSLGVVLYEMVTGVAPFTGDSPVAVAYKHVREAPVPPSQRNPAVPEALEAIILTAMAKDPDHRYQSADDMRADLQRFRRGRPLAAAPVTAIVDEYDDAERTVVASAAAPDRTRVAPPVAYAPRRRGGTVAAILVVLLLVGIVGAIIWFTSGQNDTTEVAVVPGVVGLDEESARTILVDAGFEVEIEDRVANEERPAGEVLAQDPEEGEELELGGTVRLTVSAGAGTVTIPPLTGRSVFEATTLLTEAGLEVDQVPEENEFVDEGLVLRTEPAEGTEVERGSTVRVFFSSGAPLVPVPDVLNQDEQTAFETLQRAGFVVQTQSEAHDTVPAGSVIRTEPGPNTQWQRGDTVIMVVSSGPATVEVPRVIGATQEEAIALLRASGFEVQVIEAPSTAPNDGIVIAQDPAGFTRVSPGATVQITVGVFTEPTTVPTTPPPATTTSTTAP
jgi:beta-lactam-binding protein with PASTA domain/tRNA A-37 threonylcarbamoyl transferase component Bud32